MIAQYYDSHCQVHQHAGRTDVLVLIVPVPVFLSLKVMVPLGDPPEAGVFHRLAFLRGSTKEEN
jgi:hypothetical protein